MRWPAGGAVAPFLVIALSVPGCGGNAFTTSSDVGDGGSLDSTTVIVVADGSSTPDASSPDDASDGSATASDAGCAPPLLACGADCVDPTSAEHCGSCNNACPPPHSGVGVGVCGDAGACDLLCNSGFHACHGDCVADDSPPSADACVLSERFGVFVSPGGSDAQGIGTQEAPYATLGKALDVAKKGGVRVYACGSAGSYTAENLVIAATRDGVDLFGGLDCSATPWTYDASKVAKVAPATAGYALEVTGLTTGLTIEDFELDAIDAPQTAPASGSAASSVVVFVNGSPLTLTRVTVDAGRGQPGAPGVPASNWTGTSPPGQSPPNGTTGGAGGSHMCLDAATSSNGGAGGSLTGAAPVTFGPGAPGVAVPAVGSANGGAVGGGSACTGGAGAGGTAASSGGTGATLSGLLSASGWATGVGGGSGASGNPGQGGGGGGGSSAAVVQVGSGGGAGGCGGGGGTGGGTGGSSIGILAYQAVLVLNDVTVAASSAGAGGPGGVGQDGQAGAGGATAGSCAGGSGGNGSPGAGGGGGAGGASAGVAWAGSGAPSIDGAPASQYQPDAGSSQITASLAGEGGHGGSRGDAGIAAAPGGSGASGASGAVLQVP